MQKTSNFGKKVVGIVYLLLVNCREPLKTVEELIAVAQRARSNLVMSPREAPGIAREANVDKADPACMQIFPPGLNGAGVDNVLFTVPAVEGVDLQASGCKRLGKPSCASEELKRGLSNSEPRLFCLWRNSFSKRRGKSWVARVALALKVFRKGGQNLLQPCMRLVPSQTVVASPASSSLDLRHTSQAKGSVVGRSSVSELI